jgi:hypothetical protein
VLLHCCPSHLQRLLLLVLAAAGWVWRFHPRPLLLLQLACR